MNILGINHSSDAAAALVQEGRVSAACAEERFSRIKHDAGFPHRAIAFALEGVGGDLEACDAVAFFWNPVLQMDAAHGRLTATPRSHLEYLYSLPNNLLAGRELGQTPYVELSIPRPGRGPLRLFFVAHHLCHGAHAFFEAPFSEAAILTVDGYGERTSTLIARGKGREIVPELEIPFPHSIGSVYAAITQYLGFSPNSGEGTVMGLAAYGEPRYLDLFTKLLRPTADGFEVDLAYFSYMMDGKRRYSDKLVTALGAPREPEEAMEDRHRDVAASLQAAVEEVLVHLAKLARQRTGLSRLCMAGGVTLNCLANQRIVQEAGFESCFFQPACNDAGTSAGAALYVSRVILGEDPGVLEVKSDYLGPEFSADQIRAVLELSGARYQEIPDLAEHASQRLAQGRILGRFAGRAEFGPRALGNRSILAQPGPAAMKDTLNARVKFREPFRPFAPSVDEACCGAYFDSDAPSPFMLRVYGTRGEVLERLGAVAHVDGGARVQSVNEAQNAAYLELIRAYGELSGLSCVLNTSFNIRGEPIVQTPQDAMKCFFSTDMDDLYLGPFHLEKQRGR